MAFFFFSPATKMSEYKAITHFLLSAAEAFIMFSWLILTRALRGWSRVPSHFIDEEIEIQGMSYATDDSAGVGQPQLDPALQSVADWPIPRGSKPGVLP